MRRHGAKVELWDNVKALFGARRPPAAAQPARQDNQPKKAGAGKDNKKQKVL
jgi:hypothetical protein